MFGKLVKHEWGAVRSWIGMLCLAIFVAGLLSGGVLRYMVWSTVTGNSIMVTVYSIVLAVAVLIIFGGCFATVYLMIYHFAKSRFEDEGYLTFTLPVTTHKQLLAGILNTVIGVVLVALTACASVALGMSIFLLSYEMNTMAEMINLISGIPGQILDNLNIHGWQILIAMVQGILTFLTDVVLLMLAVTVGYCVKTHPVLTGFGLYLAIDIAYSLILEVVGLWTEANFYLRSGVSCMVLMIVLLTAYFVMHRRLDKKLNLK